MCYDFDRRGNLWTLDGAGKSQLGYADYSGFGGTIASGGSGTVFGYGGANGCQTEADTGLVLMGHRYYDSRIGRFLTQDPAGDGNNWYAYARNNPVNKTDPSGLMPLMSFPEGSSPQSSPGYLGINSGAEVEALQGFLNDVVRADEQDKINASNADYKILAPGHVVNHSDYAIPILFDGKTIRGESDPHYLLWLPAGYESTFLTDIDYVFYGNDPSAKGGFDWRHIPAYTYATIYPATTNHVQIEMSDRYSVTYGLPYGWRPAPISPQQAINSGYIQKLYTNPNSSSRPFIGIGPIIM